MKTANYVSLQPEESCLENFFGGITANFTEFSSEKAN
jgi:hypothetical protein